MDDTNYEALAIGKTYIEQFCLNQLIHRGNFCDKKYLPDMKSTPLFYLNMIRIG